MSVCSKFPENSDISADVLTILLSGIWEVCPESCLPKLFFTHNDVRREISTLKVSAIG